MLSCTLSCEKPGWTAIDYRAAPNSKAAHIFSLKIYCSISHFSPKDDNRIANCWLIQSISRDVLDSVIIVCIIMAAQLFPVPVNSDFEVVLPLLDDVAHGRADILGLAHDPVIHVTRAVLLKGN